MREICFKLDELDQKQITLRNQPQNLTVESDIVLEEANNSTRVGVNCVDEYTDQNEVQEEQNRVDYGERHHVPVELYRLDQIVRETCVATSRR